MSFITQAPGRALIMYILVILCVLSSFATFLMIEKPTFHDSQLFYGKLLLVAYIWERKIRIVIKLYSLHFQAKKYYCSRMQTRMLDFVSIHISNIKQQHNLEFFNFANFRLNAIKAFHTVVPRKPSGQISKFPNR